jgi:acetylornithine deacetylase/succinyl-diaminopimelate desuccinylase-like protein
MLPGFYDRVRPLEVEERAELARLPIGEDFYLEQSGAPELFGEAGYSAAERVAARPTLEVNGLLSGYTGEGSKTVLPSKAMAKISMRLVPEQKPEEVQQQLLQYISERVPPTVRWELVKHATGNPAVTDRRFPGVTAMSQALEETWGIRPVFKREGGSVPVTAQMCEVLGVESVLAGFGLPDDNLHAPNEKMHLPTFYRGIEAMTRYFSILGKR